jgi:hypothetical protein
MHILYKPPTENVSVSIRKDYRFGLNDPLLHPQPLIPGVLHLCVIRSPSLLGASEPFSFMWKALNPDDFDNSSVKYLALGLETLRNEIHSEYRRLVLALLNRIGEFCRGHGAEGEEIRRDPWMKTYKYLALDAISLSTSSKHSVHIWNFELDSSGSQYFVPFFETRAWLHLHLPRHL